MTNSYSLSQEENRNIILIHGANNNLEAFFPLKNEFEQMGYKVTLVTLPGHGKIRKEAPEFKSAFALFNQTMLELTKVPYSVVAFSQGALYFQLWLQKHQENLPLKQVLLAPALYIHRQNFLYKLIQKLPSGLFIKSLAPKKFRRYQTFRIWEYRILLESMNTFHRHKKALKVPSLILIDPKDEMVDAKKLETELGQDPLATFKLWPRDYIRRGLTYHHILFHPDHFQKDDWQAFIKEIQVFLRE